MKKFLLFLLLGISVLSYGQTMLLTPSDTVEEFVTTTDFYDIFSQHIYVINPGSVANYKWELVNVQSEPSPSKVNLCDPNQCYPIPPGNIFEFPIAQNDSADMKAEVLPRCQSGTYSLRVRVYNVTPGSTDEKFLTYITHVTNACPTSVNEVNPDLFSLSQNPFSDEVQLNISSQEVNRFRIYDFQGRLIADLQTADKIIRMGKNWDNGSYVLQLISADGEIIQTAQLIKVK
jgi:hypothetical protein